MPAFEIARAPFPVTYNVRFQIPGFTPARGICFTSRFILVGNLEMLPFTDTLAIVPRWRTRKQAAWADRVTQKPSFNVGKAWAKHGVERYHLVKLFEPNSSGIAEFRLSARPRRRQLP
jgi:hypothetical protein